MKVWVWLCGRKYAGVLRMNGTIAYVVEGKTQYDSAKLLKWERV